MKGDDLIMSIFECNFDYLVNNKENKGGDSSFCLKCGGKCCLSMPGAAFPEDFKEPLKDNLKFALLLGDWSIDWWEGSPFSDINNWKNNDWDYNKTAYFIRPATKSSQYRLKDPSWGGECVFLQNNGCELSFDKRPKNCRFLEPIGEKECKLHDESDKKSAAIAWWEYNDMIEEIINELEGE
jgi:Fe-S-cluster containining protein